MRPRERIVVFTGAGVSAESGLRTFRDGDGLWEEHRLEDVATPGAWQRDPELVLRFYDERRAHVRRAVPNAAHLAIASLQDHFEVDVVTQNIDDLHERACSRRVLHLHGEILMARSSVDPKLRYPLTGDTIPREARCAKGSPLRPDVVWFGEPVPLILKAADLVAAADRLVIVGTSLQVWPAAGLVMEARPDSEVVIIDPAQVDLPRSGIRHIRKKASSGMPELAFQWIRSLEAH